MRLYISKEDLYNDYHIVGMSTRDIAIKYNIGQTTVRRLMAFYGISSRDNSIKTEYYYAKMQPKWEVFKEKNKKWHTKTCELCGREFEIDYTSKNKKYCSQQCRIEAAKLKKKKYYCQRCGKETGKRYYTKYCDECFAIARKERPTDRITTQCGYCGREIKVIKSRYDNNRYCYCDTDCMSKHYAEIYSGENSPSWKGGKRHYTGGWFMARDLARDRDNYTCQICGITEEDYGKEMSVHHIKKYRSFEDKTEANELSNLVCLCEHCHRFVHSKQNIDKIYIKE